MQDSNSFPSFQPERGDSLAEELYPDLFATTFPLPDPGPVTASELYAMRSVQRRTARTEKRAVRAERSTDRVGAMQANPVPLSLTDALQASIARKRPKKGQLVISGEKKRQRNTYKEFQVRPAWHLSPSLRLVILFVVILLILLVVLLLPISLSMSREAFPSHLVMIG